jgi:DnaJ-class molecular chaperone
VTIPKGSNTGTILRLKGKGIADRQGTRGDQYVTLKVMLPEKPDEDLERFVESWSRSYDVRSKMGPAG